ncbi:hypothetical protein FOPE_00899 [Fonsecaea pedrosoi]|nr:hypothetical protein FOPE_00899 [Fonsecaea pedrosoi]
MHRDPSTTCATRPDTTAQTPEQHLKPSSPVKRSLPRQPILRNTYTYLIFIYLMLTNLIKPWGHLSDSPHAITVREAVDKR